MLESLSHFKEKERHNKFPEVLKNGGRNGECIEKHELHLLSFLGSEIVGVALVAYYSPDSLYFL